MLYFTVSVLEQFPQRKQYLFVNNPRLSFMIAGKRMKSAMSIIKASIYCAMIQNYAIH